MNYSFKSGLKRQQNNRYFHFQIIRQDVYTDMNVVPILLLKKCSSTGRVQHLNAYALDFFKHGSEKVIERENGLVINKIIHGIEFLLRECEAYFPPSPLVVLISEWTALPFSWLKHFSFINLFAVFVRRIKAGEVFTLLKDFYLTIKSIR